MINITRLRGLYEAGQVQRWHTVPHLQDASLARHQWGAAMILMELNPTARPSLVHATLVHDIPERWGGDIPSPARSSFPDTLGEGDKRMGDIVYAKLGMNFGLDDFEVIWVKFCDVADALLWSQCEQLLGNQMIKTPHQKLFNTILEMGKQYDFLKTAADAVLQVDFCLGDRLPDRIEEVN